MHHHVQKAAHIGLERVMLGLLHGCRRHLSSPLRINRASDGFAEEVFKMVTVVAPKGRSKA